MGEGSWPGDGKAQPDEDDGEDGPQGALRNGVRDASSEEDAGDGAREHGGGERDVDAARLQMAEGGEGRENQRVDEIGADHRLRRKREEESENAQEKRAAPDAGRAHEEAGDEAQRRRPSGRGRRRGPRPG